MARCKVGDKKVKQLREQTGLDVVGAFVRGGTDHRIDLLIKGGTVKHLYKDGKIEESEIRWDEYKSETEKQLEEFGKAVDELKKSIYKELRIEDFVRWLDIQIFEHPTITHLCLALFTALILILFVIMAGNIISKFGL